MSASGKSRRSKRTGPTSRPYATSAPARRLDATWFDRGGDFALAGILFVAPIFMGGRHPLGKLIYIILVTIFTGCWLGKQAVERDGSWISTKVEWLLSGGVLLLILQLVHWPDAVLKFLSPHQSQLLPQWPPQLANAMHLGGWDQVSLTPHATWMALGIFVAHAMLFVTLVQRLQSMEKIEHLGLPFAPIGKPEDMFDDPHLNASGGLLDMELEDGQAAKLPALPVALNGERIGLRLSPPKIGEHTDVVMREAGLSEDQISAMRDGGVIQ